MATSSSGTSSKKIGEIEIPVPWGHVAAKTWGEASDPLILCVHGIMDNAGTFDLIIPMLPSSYYYVCIDLPGHGKSSHFPPHLPIHSIDFLLVYKAASRYFKRKFTIMGHSYGGKLGFLYAQMYPECVVKLIMLESTMLYPVRSDFFTKYVADKTNGYFKINNLETKRPPLYTREEALDKIQNGRNFKPVRKEAAEALLERAVEPVVGERFKFNLDQRIKNFIDPLRDHRYIIDTMKISPVKCPILTILGNENTYQINKMKPFLDVLTKWKNADLVIVEGGHDVHNESPGNVVSHIHKFLLTEKGKL